LPEPTAELALAGRFEPGTGTVGLIPAPPSSVEPKGIPTRPTKDDEGRADGGIRLSVQESDVPPESPPPSNSAPGDPALPDAAQGPVACEGLTGDRPGVAISVEPKGMPSGRVDPEASGDVARMPTDGCIAGGVA
jgi:hypothetical protein